MQPQHVTDGMDLVSDSRDRRYLLYCLYVHSGPLELPAVADTLTDWQRHGYRDRDHRLQRRLRLYSTLYHDHIPPLCDGDVISYSQSDDVVALDSVGRQLKPRLKRTYWAEIVDILEQTDTGEPFD